MVNGPTSTDLLVVMRKLDVIQILYQDHNAIV